MTGLAPGFALLLAVQVLAAQPEPGKPSTKRDLESSGPMEYIAAATSLTLQNDFDDAQRVIDRGRARFPEAQGFHLKQGDLCQARGKIIEAFYEFQWELMRAGSVETGPAAGRAIAALVKSEQRGLEYDEIHVVLLAMAKLHSDPAGALADLKRVEETRGPRFALTLLIAEAHVQNRNLDTAVGLYRTLITRDPHFVPAYVELAGVLRLQQKPKDAEALDAKARAIDPRHPSLVLSHSP